MTSWLRWRGDFGRRILTRAQWRGNTTRRGVPRAYSMTTSVSEMSMVSRSRRLCIFECSAQPSSSISAPANGSTGQKPSSVAAPATPKVTKQTRRKTSARHACSTSNAERGRYGGRRLARGATIPANLRDDSMTYELLRHRSTPRLERPRSAREIRLRGRCPSGAPPKRLVSVSILSSTSGISCASCLRSSRRKAHPGIGWLHA